MIFSSLRKNGKIGGKYILDLRHIIQPRFCRFNFVPFGCDRIYVHRAALFLEYFTHSSFTRSVCERDPETSFEGSIIGDDCSCPWNVILCETLEHHKPNRNNDCRCKSAVECGFHQFHLRIPGRASGNIQYATFFAYCLILIVNFEKFLDGSNGYRFNKN